MKNRLDIIEALERARKTQGLTQADLAARAGASRVTVGRVEAGFDPKLATVHELARALGLELTLVPKALSGEVQAFIRSGGRVLGQPSGATAPPSVVEQASVAQAPHLHRPQVLAAGGLARPSVAGTEMASELNEPQPGPIWSAWSAAQAIGGGPAISPAASAKLHGVKGTGNPSGSGA